MTIGNLMRLLSDGEVHSGEQLGEALGVSRAAVWKQLKKLEALGVELVAVKGRGYRLAHPLEPLDGAKIVERLPADARHLLARLFVEDQLCIVTSIGINFAQRGERVDNPPAYRMFLHQAEDSQII